MLHHIVLFTWNDKVPAGHPAIAANDWGNRVYTTNKRLSLVKKRRIDQQIRSFIFDTFKAVIFWIKNGESEIR